MTKIVYEKDYIGTLEVIGNRADILIALSEICESLYKKGFSEEEIRDAVDMAFKSEKELNEELDKAMKELVEMLIKNAK